MRGRACCCCRRFPLCSLGTKGTALLRGANAKEDNDEWPRSRKLPTLWTAAEQVSRGNLLEHAIGGGAAGAWKGSECSKWSDHAFLHLDEGEPKTASRNFTNTYMSSRAFCCRAETNSAE
jgi:hypothetical protein